MNLSFFLFFKVPSKIPHILTSLGYFVKTEESLGIQSYDIKISFKYHSNKEFCDLYKIYLMS